MSAAPRAFLAAAVVGAAVRAAPDADLVTGLPGWDGALPSKHYSGFLNASTHHVHYVFVEASTADPATAPVILWLNGGPGASSFGFGYLTEIGPFYVEADGNTAPGALPKLLPNPTAWTTIANVLFLESPASVGFSYCGTDSKSEPCKWTDDTAAALNFAALGLFFANFPEYTGNHFEIWGESYAGIYIPMLADLVLNATASAAAIGTTASVPKLEGIGVGNGCLGTEVGACSAQGTKIDVDFLYGHGAISQPTYAALYAQCPDFTNPTLVCDDWLDTMSEEAGNYYAYNLYDDCGPNGQTSRHTHRTWREHNADRAATWGTLGPGNPTGTHDFGYPCGKQAGAAAWLNNAKVRVALHVPPEAFYGHPFSLITAIQYTRTVPSLVDTYLRIIPKTKVLVFNGDLDPCVPYNGNEEWTRGLGLAEAADGHWQPWMSDPGTGSQIAGYKTVYEHGFTFATVKGAGHMVPQYQPQRALDLFSSWITTKQLPAAAPPPVDTLPSQKVELPAAEAPSRNPYSWSAVVDVLVEDVVKHPVPPGRNPLGASRDADEVKSLPGWDGALPSKHYSGYLDVPVVTGGKKDIHIHYWLAESEGNPAKDPVVFWMNGGPGGSSLIGGLTENGPFYLDDSSFTDPSFTKTGVPKLYQRPQTWAKMANMVYVETPAMTGFSYCDNDCVWDDDSTADAHYQMTLAFIDAFPEFKNRELYFTGESYAGLYIPMVSDRILNNTAEVAAHGVNLQGFMIGNGCPGWDVLTCTPYSCGHTGGICAGGGTEVAVDFRFGHGFASQPTYAQYTAICGDQRWDDPSPACIAAINAFTDETGTGGLAGSTYNVYDMCGDDDAAAGFTTSAEKRADGAAGIYAPLNDQKRRTPALVATTANTTTGARRVGDHANGKGGLNNYPCGEAVGMTAWLNVNAVQDALHVTVAHRPGGKWAPSTGLNFTHTQPTLLHMYPRLIDKLRILLFSGDVDECVPYNGAEQWTRGFGYEEAEHWHPWVVDSSVAGYATVYKTPHKFTWATVRGAGHMAPLFQPLRLLDLFDRFIHNKAI